MGGNSVQEEEIKRKMRKLKIFDKDIKEKFVRSSGPGGQNVNKVSTCVTLVHVPTGIQVKCQAGRTQAINRQRARYLLVKKIEKVEHDRRLKETQKREKLKRQTRKRPKRLKEEILERKHKQSEKKQNRQKIRINKLEDY